MNRAWLFRLGGLGDLLVALPAIRLVRKALPEARLLLVGRREYGAMLQETGLVDAAVSADEPRWASWLAAPSDPDKIPDIGPDELVIGWFHKRGDNRFSAFFEGDPLGTTPLFQTFFKATEEYFRSRGYPVFPFEACARLPVSDEQRRRGRLLLGEGAGAEGAAVVHPGSGSRRKCWPLDRFLAIVEALAEKGMSGAVITGEAESRLEPDLRRTILPPGWIWRPIPRLSDLAGLLASADLYFGNDSGVTHLAAVCGVRVVAIFRDEFRLAWRPCGDVRMLSAPDVSDISASSVLNFL
jgi:heptosyltransferase-3